MTQQPPKAQDRRSIFLGLQLKLIVGFTLVFSVVFAVAFYWFFTFAESAALQKVQEDLRNTLDGAVQGMDRDAFMTIRELVHEVERPELAEGQLFIPHTNYFSEDQVPGMDFDAYETHVQWLADVHHVAPNAVIYTFVPGPAENQVTYIATNAMLTTGPGGEDPGTIGVDYGYIATDGEGFDLIENFQALSSPLPIYNFDGYSDVFGNWISGYQGVRDEEGNVVGAVGVDFNLAYVDQVRRDILNSVLFAFIIAYVSLFILVWLVARTLTGPIQHLTGAAREIGKGNYQTTALDRYKVQPLIRDEIHALGTVISDMRDQVYKREQKLISQVRELKIEIDEAKAKQQVDEIVESDFFDHLQKRVKDMRKRDEEKRTTGTHDVVDEKE